MPRTDNVSVQQYGIVVSGEKSICPSPAMISRMSLRIRNTGENACELRFGKPCVGDVNSWDLQPGNDIYLYDDCPVESINLRCNVAGGTTVVIIEGRPVADAQTSYVRRVK